MSKVDPSSARRVRVVPSAAAPHESAALQRGADLRRRAGEWCDAESRRWLIHGASMLAHAARACTHWGWAGVRLRCVDTADGTAELDITLPSGHAALPSGALESWFEGVMDWIALDRGQSRSSCARWQRDAGGGVMRLRSTPRAGCRGGY